MKKWKHRLWQLMLCAGGLAGLLLNGCSCGDGGPEPDAGPVAVLQGSENFVVTDCLEELGGFRVTINNALVIHDIRWAGDRVILPYQESSGGKKYETITPVGEEGDILIRDIKAAVAAVAAGGSIPPPPAECPAIEITEVTGQGARRSGIRVADTARWYAHVTINGGIKISPFRVIRNRADENEYWINWPSRRVTRTSIEQVACSATDLSRIIEETIFDEFIDFAKLDPTEVRLGYRLDRGSQGGTLRSAGKVAITGIRETAGTFSVTLWDEVTIHGIRVEGDSVLFSTPRHPLPILRSPKWATAVGLEAVMAAVKEFAVNRTFTPTTADPLRISDVFTRPGRYKPGGGASITLNDAITLDYIQINDDTGMISVNPPLEDGKPRIEFRTTSLWVELEKKVIADYRVRRRHQR